MTDPDSDNSFECVDVNIDRPQLFEEAGSAVEHGRDGVESDESSVNFELPGQETKEDQPNMKARVCELERLYDMQKEDNTILKKALRQLVTYVESLEKESDETERVVNQLLREKSELMDQIAAGSSATLTSKEAIKEREARVMFAMFDYDASADSPNVDAEIWELSFRRGDAITIYGEMDQDGWFEGEINGKKGLVPRNFLNLNPEDTSSDVHPIVEAIPTTHKSRNFVNSKETTKKTKKHHTGNSREPLSGPFNVMDVAYLLLIFSLSLSVILFFFSFAGRIFIPLREFLVFSALTTILAMLCFGYRTLVPCCTVILKMVIGVCWIIGANDGYKIISILEIAFIGELWATWQSAGFFEKKAEVKKRKKYIGKTATSLR